MAEGYIYLRHQSGHGYCFGKTGNEKRRDSEYRKENPFLKKVGSFHTYSMEAAENYMAEISAQLRLLKNSREWLRESEQVLVLFERARSKWEGRTWEEVESRERAKREAADSKRKKLEADRAALRESRKELPWLKRKLDGIESHVRQNQAIISGLQKEAGRHVESWERLPSTISAYLSDMPAVLFGSAIAGFLGAAFVAQDLESWPFISGFLFCADALCGGREMGGKRQSRMVAIKNYESVPSINVRIEKLRKEIIQNQSEAAELKKKIHSVETQKVAV